MIEESRENGQAGGSREVEVTPAMVAAGVSAYLAWSESDDPYIRNLVRWVLFAAIEASPDQFRAK